MIKAERAECQVSKLRSKLQLWLTNMEHAFIKE